MKQKNQRKKTLTEKWLESTESSKKVWTLQKLDSSKDSKAMKLE